jgi:hypothetical protein
MRNMLFPSGYAIYGSESNVYQHLKNLTVKKKKKLNS